MSTIMPLHWAQDETGSMATACGLGYGLSPERTRDVTAVTCPFCRDRINHAMQNLLAQARGDEAS